MANKPEVKNPLNVAKAEGLAIGKLFADGDLQLQQSRRAALETAAKALTPETLDSFMEGFKMGVEKLASAKQRAYEAKKVLSVLLTDKANTLRKFAGTWADYVAKARELSGGESNPRRPANALQSRTVKTVVENIGAGTAQQQTEILAATAQALLAKDGQTIAAFKACGEILSQVIQSEKTEAPFKVAAEKALDILDKCIDRAKKSADAAIGAAKKASKASAPAKESEPAKPAQAAQEPEVQEA